jgi:peroxiredoxin
MPHPITQRVLTIAVLAALIWQSETHAQVPEVGDLAPDFTLQELEGVDVSLSDFRGKVVLISFFGYNCPVCIGKAGKIEAIWQDFREEEFMLLGVDVWNGNATQVRSFWISLSKSTYPLLLKGGKTGTRYGFVNNHFAVIDHEGIVQYRSSGSLSQSFQEDDIRNSIQEAIGNLPVVAPPEEPFSAVEHTSWGQIKTNAP